MDDSEFIEWVAGHQRQLLRSAYLLTGDLHRAQDLVQEALVKVALRWPRLRSGNPAGYARTIIVHDNVSWWRRHRRELTSAAPGETPRVSSDPEAALVDAATSYLPIAGTTYRPGIGSAGDVGGVSPIAWLDDKKVLLKHGSTLGKPWTLVAWDVVTGELVPRVRGSGQPAAGRRRTGPRRGLTEPGDP
ncbi:MAG: sigma-70 region 4 type 2 [Nocardioides sp.]|nr:sigma-70 region 4 type 2 [Nocardioides sp.]